MAELLPGFEAAVVAKVSLAVHRATSDIARVSSEDFAPKGATLQLSRGIRAIQPVVGSDGIIVGRIISSAKSKGGYDYAEKQHNVNLRHFSEQPLRQGFIDAGSGRTRRARYQDGYIKLRDSSPKFATEYLTKSYEARREVAVRIVSRAIEAV